MITVDGRRCACNKISGLINIVLFKKKKKCVNILLTLFVDDDRVCTICVCRILFDDDDG